jgi:hypothetical protein
MAVVLNRPELDCFLALAKRDRGDPSQPVFVLSVNCSKFPEPTDVTARFHGGNLLIEVGADCPLPIPVDLDGPIVIDGKLAAFHIRKMGHGAWALSPSLNMPGILHAFVVLHGAPDPAPWERTIFLATEDTHG